ncbi:MAG: glycosyltransferase, partial [Candidatus Lokiarchaeota archaeon]|nr:glycosyltransferase [Candidatus Lokiarchaeota archaeon]
MGKKKLSILICSLTTRQKLLQRLLYRLRPQLTDEIEIIYELDHGQMEIGVKRNRLLRKATGKYISFVDDDDLVSYHYIHKILKAIESGPDCCGITGIMTGGKYPGKFVHSLKYNKWYRKGDTYYRPPNHLNPVLRTKALKVGFPPVNKGEDRTFSERIKSSLKSEKFIKAPIYFYLRERIGPSVINSVSVRGDFSLRIRMRIANLKDSACGVVINDSIFGFQGKHTGKTFLEGSVFNGQKFSVSTGTLMRNGRRFTLKVKRKKDDLFFSIDGKFLFGVKYKKDKLKVGLR